MQVGDLGELFYDKVEPDSDVVTWVYEEGSFTPIAKLADGERFSIVSDYLGTPVQAFDASGELVWERELNIYGGIRKETGAANFVAMRYQGQYFDEETGLCYNRHRYYDPGSGLYLSQDPIGLAGGTALYGYVHDTNAWVDVEGLNSIFVNPNDINFSQRTVSEVRVFDASKYKPINVIEVDGQLVSYDNRRLLSAQNTGIEKLEVNVVKADDIFPDSTTGKTWGQKFKERFKDIRNKKAGGVVPEKGLKEKPEISCG